MINTNAIKKGIQKAINISPTNITILRPNMIDDGYGGSFLNKEIPYITVAKVDIFLNQNTSSKSQTTYTEGGKVDSISGVTAIILIEDFTIQIGDFFIHDNKKYTIKYFNNIYGVYWSADLEVKLNVD